FYRTKAKNIINSSKLIVQNFGGEVPNTMQELLSLPGVARKTANIVLFHAYGKNEGIAVDTHCMRISHRLGLTSKRNNQSLSEKELMSIICKEDWGMYTNWMVHHGRKYCTARSPKCGSCPLGKICPKKGVEQPAHKKNLPKGIKRGANGLPAKSLK
ncbi:MAG: endonuclease III, partial [Candidatus Micrarchaeota archaeon]